MAEDTPSFDRSVNAIATKRDTGTDYAYRIITAPTPSDFHTCLRFCIGYIVSKSSQLEILKTRAHTTSFSKPDTVLIQLAQVAFFLHPIMVT